MEFFLKEKVSQMLCMYGETINDFYIVMTSRDILMASRIGIKYMAALFPGKSFSRDKARGIG